MASAAAIADLANGFNRLPGRNKFGVMIATALLITLLAGSWLWGTTPEYRVLFSNVSDRDGGAVIAALNQMNVPYRMSDGGTAILVPEKQVHDTRLKLASQGLPKGSIVQSPCKSFYLQLIEPEPSVLDVEGDESLQRVAFGCPDVLAAAKALQAQGVEFVESQGVHTDNRGAITKSALGGVMFELVHHAAPAQG